MTKTSGTSKTNGRKFAVAVSNTISRTISRLRTLRISDVCNLSKKAAALITLTALLIPIFAFGEIRFASAAVTPTAAPAGSVAFDFDGKNDLATFALKPTW